MYTWAQYRLKMMIFIAFQQEPRKELADSCKQGDLETAKALLKAGADADGETRL